MTSNKNLKVTQIIGVVVLISFIIISSITSSFAENQNQNRRIYVVNYPLQYFAERIGGDNVNVFFPAPPDIDPAFWTPGREVIRQYQKADLILLNGAGYAKWIDKVTLPKSKLVDTSQSFKSEYIPLHHAVTHTHGPTGEHAHTGVAFTTWLDPFLAIKQAEAIKDAFINLMPESEESFTENYESLKTDLEGLNNRLLKIVSVNPEKPILGSHPVYQYLARRYQLNLISLHWEPDQKLEADQLKKLDILLENHPAHWMIWEATPSQQNIDLLKKMGIGSMVFNPSAGVPVRGDYIDVMNSNADNLREVFN